MENNNDGYKQFRITIEDENLRNATTVNGQELTVLILIIFKY